MTYYNQNSHTRTIFHDFSIPQKGSVLAGYAALIDTHELRVPAPDSLCIIGVKHKKYAVGRWNVFTPRHRPEDTLYGHLKFALKYEGINLAVLKALFQVINAEVVEAIIRSEPTGIYSRKIWFLWEWLREEQLDLDDAKKSNFVTLVNSKLQFEGKDVLSKRHRVRNNLPGTKNFCPLIRKTKKLEQFLNKKLSEEARQNISRTNPNLLSRAATLELVP